MDPPLDKDADVVRTLRRNNLEPVAGDLPAAGADAGGFLLLSAEAALLEEDEPSSEALINLRMESLTPRKFLQLEQVKRVQGLDSVKSKILTAMAFPESS